MNAEISVFSIGDLNKYEFLKRIDLNYKPNALDKARFEFSPLGRAFNEGLDQTIPNYQEEGVIKLLKEIRDNLAGLPMLPGPPGPPNPPIPPSPPIPPRTPSTPSPPIPPSPLRLPSLTNITTPSSSSLANVTPLPPSSSDGAIKQIKGQDKSSKLLKKYYKKPKKDIDIDIDDIMKEINEQEEKNKLLEEQRKLLKQKNEQDKILKQQNDEQKKLLEEQKKIIEEEQQEENILRNITFENIDSGPIAEFRSSFQRRYIKKPTPSPSKIPVLSKIPAPITKSREPQGVVVGEQAGIAIMENKLKTSKNYIEYLEKELRNTDFSLKKALEITNKIIKEEDEVRKLEKEIHKREEDLERRFRKYYPDNYHPYKK